MSISNGQEWGNSKYNSKEWSDPYVLRWGKVNNILISRKKSKFHKKYVWFIIKKAQTRCVCNINISLSMQSKTSGMIDINQFMVSIFWTKLETRFSVENQGTVLNIFHSRRMVLAGIVLIVGNAADTIHWQTLVKAQNGNWANGQSHLIFPSKTHNVEEGRATEWASAMSRAV